MPGIVPSILQIFFADVFIGQFDNGNNWEIDGPIVSFENGFEKIYHRNIKTVVKKYYDLTREMIAKSCPDIIGHFDKIKMEGY